MATCKGLKLVCISCQSLELGSLCYGWHKYKAAIKTWACSQSISSTDKSSGPKLLLFPIFPQPHSFPHFTGAVLAQWPLLSHHSCRLAGLTLIVCKNPLFSFSWALFPSIGTPQEEGIYWWLPDVSLNHTNQKAQAQCSENKQCKSMCYDS